MVTYELRKKKGLKSSVYAIALVENPAIEVGFVTLSKDARPQFQSQIKLAADKQMLYTPVLIPNQKIYREDESGQGYYIFFSEETIEEAAKDFLSAKLVDNFNNEHQENERLQGVTVVESWVVEDEEKDKAYKYGFDVPVGTWMAGIKIEDKDIWLKCKNGTYKGISIEGLFDNFTANFNQSNYINMDKKETAVSQILTKLGELLSPTKLASAELANGGIIYTEGEFADGVNVYQDEAMQVLAQDGEYELADGRVLSVVEGKAASLREAVEEDMSENLSQEELAKHVLTIAEKLEGLQSQVAELSKAHEELSANYNKVTEENKEVKAELAKVKENPAGKSATKLSENAKPSKVGAILSGQYI